MKHALLAAWVLCLAMCAPTAATPLVLQKDAGGSISAQRLELVLASVAPCDATKDTIPDSSRLVSDKFTLTTDDKGIGFFAGAVRIVGPDSKALFTGVLHGTAGLAAPYSTDCLAPGHLEGMLNGAMTGATPASTGVLVGSIVEVHFVADVVPQAAGVAPLYKGRLSGLITLPPPASTGVLLKAVRPEYLTTEPIAALIANRTTSDIRTWDGESYCTIVRVEMQSGDTWLPMFDCPLAKPTVPVTIKAGQMRSVLLPPSGDPKKDPGVYRLSLKYVPLNATGAPAGDAVVVKSDPFRVVAPPEGKVEVRPSALAYRTDQPISAVVINHTATPIVGHAFYSYCTILTLQIKSDVDWKTVAMCMLTGGPSVTIQPGETKPVLLPPDPDSPATKDPGTYRLLLRYETPDSNTGLTAVSPEFLVVAAPTPASLTVRPDKAAYSTTEPISVTLTNGPTAVRIMDEQTLCTIVQLQRRDGDAWTLVEPCPLDRLPLPTYLKPGEVKVVTLAKTTPWIPGLHRLAVTFAGVTSGGEAGADQTAYSAPFSIAEPPAPTGKVVLLPSRLVYGETDRIIGIVANAKPVPIVTWDEKSYCTMLTLQIKTSTGWKSLGPCALFRMPDPVTILPNSTVSVALPPEPAPVKNDRGTYRMVLAYAELDSAGLPGTLTEVISPEFIVQTPMATVRKM